jgi:diguanylate cyclase (GGDEF)-like protein/PAS domain S-box-containing protein
MRIANLPRELGSVAEALDLIAESGRARQRGLGELTRSLFRSRQLLTKALANMHEGVLILDAESGNVVDCNPAIARIFGYDRDAIIGHSPDLLHLTKENGADFRRQLEEAFAERGFLRHPGLRLCRENGSVTYADITAVPLEDEAGCRFGVMCIIHDVTELRQYERRLAYLATHDQLTGLPSRRGLEEGLAEAVAVAADGGLASALLVIDIVHFREVNDALGLQAGDEVLAAVARCIQVSLRGTDVAARLGSDEFAVLLRWTEYGAARLVAERLRRTVETEFARLGAGRFSLKLSVGMALIDGSIQVAGVLGRATAALSEAKRGGGDRIVMTLGGCEPTSRAECP